MKRIAPSILSADFAHLGDEIKAAAAAGADWIHVDVMDGQFVPNITIGPLVVEAIRPVTRLPIDVHLMIVNPDPFIDAFAKAGADWICVQAEACPHLHRTIQRIRDAGARPGVALNPGTDVDAVKWVVDDLDYVLVMSVNPGFGGQRFIPQSLEKIKILRAMVDRLQRKVLIQVDGGINNATVAEVSKAGCDVFVAGSAIFGEKDYGAAIAELRSRIEP